MKEETFEAIRRNIDYYRSKQGSNWAGPIYAVNEDSVQNQRLVTITNRLQREKNEALINQRRKQITPAAPSGNR